MCKAPWTVSVKLGDFILCHHIWREKNWVNCGVMTGNKDRPQNCPFQSSFTQTTVQFTQVITQFPRFTYRHHDGIISRHSTSASLSSDSFIQWASHDIFLFNYHFLLHILRFLFLFSDNIMADVTSKQQPTALFLSTTVTRTRRHTELTKKPDKRDEKPVLCQRTFSSVFRALLEQSLTVQFYWECMEPWNGGG
jgi:hypothetical protein